MDRSEYIFSAYQVLESQSSSEELIVASRVGLMLRNALGGARWVDFGFRALKDLLLAMEHRGLLRIEETTSGALAVQVEDAKNLPLERSIASDGNHARSFQRLRPEIWSAFVVSRPTGRRFLNRETGVVLTGQSEPPTPVDDWVEMPSIPAEDQRNWAMEYLSERELSTDSDLLESLASHDWYRTFPEALGSRSPEFTLDWNRRRSNLVMQQVRQWCDAQNVDHERAFPVQGQKDRLQTSRSLFESDMRWDDDSMRLVVLDALATAPVEWLLELPIPAKYVFKALGKKRGRF